MKKKIEINSLERTGIVAALDAYNFPRLAKAIDRRYEAAPDPADDGPEVAILRERL